MSRSLHIDQAFDWCRPEWIDWRASLDLLMLGGTQGESSIYGVLEILKPTIGPLELILFWSAAEDRKSLLNCLHVGHIFVAVEENERS